LSSELSAAGVSRSVIGDAALVISELVGNAIRHAHPLPGGAVRVEWSLRPNTVEIAVTDGGSSEVPVAVDAEDTAIGGRGLSIVEALSQTWGTRRAERGMVVWAQVARKQGGRSRGCGELAIAT
jgi:anti-sigma regulatory factor (Ser/Thr protein kinase)